VSLTAPDEATSASFASILKFDVSNKICFSPSSHNSSSVTFSRSVRKNCAIPVNKLLRKNISKTQLCKGQKGFAFHFISIVLYNKRKEHECRKTKTNEASPTRTDNPEEIRDSTGISYATNCATASVRIGIRKFQHMNHYSSFFTIYKYLVESLPQLVDCLERGGWRRIKAICLHLRTWEVGRKLDGPVMSSSSRASVSW